MEYEKVGNKLRVKVSVDRTRDELEFLKKDKENIILRTQQSLARQQIDLDKINAEIAECEKLGLGKPVSVPVTDDKLKDSNSK